MSTIITLQGRELQVVAVDFETYFDKTYSLSKRNYTTTLYVRDPLFKAHGVGLCLPDGTLEWHTHESIADALHAIDWANTAFLAHNAAFDGLIASHHYQVYPAYYLDTMSMSKGLRGMNGSHSLNALAALFGLGQKTEGVLSSTQGKRDLTEEELHELGEYCKRDTLLTRQCYDRLMSLKYPRNELHIIDLVIRAFADPLLIVDPQMCLDEIDREQQEVSALLQKVGVSPSQLSSNPKFAQLLMERGVEPPTKISPKTGEITWAFDAKDIDFQRLSQREDLADLFLARRRVKSRIVETRAHQLLAHGRPALPIMLNYGATQTHRLSGGDKLNLQNLPSGRGAGQSDKLRRSIQAPPGYKLVIVDSAQIECRVAAALAEEHKLLRAFSSGGDPYCDLASKIFNYPVTKGMPERNVGKAGILSLQYGVGAKRFHLSVISGAAGPPFDLDESLAQKAVQVYRSTYTGIVNFWRLLSTGMYHMASANPNPVKIGIFRFEQERVLMPNGLYMYYPGLHSTSDEMEDFIYKKHNGWVKLYPQKLFEQLVQSTSRTIFLNQTLEIAKSYPRIPFTVHDEAIFLVKEEEADECLNEALYQFSREPDWLPVPLAGEGSISQCYKK